MVKRGGRSPRRSARRGLGAGAVIPVLFFAGGMGRLLPSCAPPGENPTASAWEQGIQKDYEAVVEDTFVIAEARAMWFDGKESSVNFTRLLNYFVPDFVNARDAIESVLPLSSAPRAGMLYTQSADLYLEYLRVEIVDSTIADGPLRAQLDLVARRIRIMGDRAYDRAHAAVDPADLDQKTRTIELPDDVPDWTAEGLAAGPPLDAMPPPPARIPPSRPVSRAQEAQSRWNAQVDSVGVPAATGLAAAIDRPGHDELQGLSDLFAIADRRLANDPDPQDGREEGATLRLGILVDAEAARVAEAAVTVTDPVASGRLTASAQRLALVGDALWNVAAPSDVWPPVPPRTSGFDPADLQRDGP